jgi:hypothetical protein
MGGKVLSAGVLLGVCWSGSWLFPASCRVGGVFGTHLLAARVGSEDSTHPTAAPEKVESLWRTDFEKAFAEAKAGRKPVFVVFRCEH